MIWARWAGVMGAMKWEIARIFVVGTGGSGFWAEAASSGVIGFFMAVGPYSSFGILLFIVSLFDARTASAGRYRGRKKPARRSSLKRSNPSIRLTRLIQPIGEIESAKSKNPE